MYPPPTIHFILPAWQIHGNFYPNQEKNWEEIQTNQMMNLSQIPFHNNDIHGCLCCGQFDMNFT